MSSKNKILILISGTVLVALALCAGLVVASLQSMISKRLAKGWILPPLEIYSQGLHLTAGRQFPLRELVEELKHRQLQGGRDFWFARGQACDHPETLVGDREQPAGFPSDAPAPENQVSCFLLKTPRIAATWDAQGFTLSVSRGDPLVPAASFALFPQLITQFYDGQPILQQNTSLGEIPLSCLQAVTAIEDRDFLEHGGVSATGTLRAMLRNLRTGRWAEGGSTITQQLVKNFFLTPKKTLRRKLEEQVLALLLESQMSKDQILEMYLNVIYMGQSGPYQVRGFGSASRFYFDRPIAELNLADCAMLAALINSPGRYNPVEHPEKARQRRELVLRKMRQNGMIDETDLGQAMQSPLPIFGVAQKHIHAPYFVMSALKEFQSWELDAEEGARLYTSLDADVQNQITESATRLLPLVEKRVRKPSKQPLEVAVITVDLATGQILGLIGGRDYRSTQYNRATDSRRQIGSIVKPFVYWPAMAGQDASPLTPVLDAPFEWKMAGQTWRPKNYENGNQGTVPYFYALAESLNVPAARVGQDIGLGKIAEAIRNSGIRGEVPLLPSLTLGAFELSLAEVAQGYSTLARFGQPVDYVHSLERVEDQNGNVLFARQPGRDIGLTPVPTALLVGMLTQSLNVGTAKAARQWGLSGEYAGKTGTTSDTKDAWFAGFNGRLLTVVWVGYDDNTAMGLTGAGAALPIWVDLAKKLEKTYRPEGFKWPAGAEPRAVTREELLNQFRDLKGRDLPDELTLVFPAWAS